MSSVYRAPGMPALLLVTLAGFTGYAVLLPTAALWVLRGGADLAGAGLVNGVVLLFTVLTQPVIPALLRRFGWGPVLATGVGQVVMLTCAWIALVDSGRGRMLPWIFTLPVYWPLGAAAAQHLDGGMVAIAVVQPPRARVQVPVKHRRPRDRARP